ncbi:transcriptional regulator [Lysinibacillus sp. fls2-241-R2A-57]|uniref:transcriptional regulator n=1 Tax=Lysinibacillus sp. fls2-241-R2A-57 TaxID=3040292 RepID=UPI0025564125|nr:transcriptional regulator [Lysinibacillus sp. fls2-241-R2A-57]
MLAQFKIQTQLRQGEIDLEQYEQFDLEPINFYYYVNQLSQEQLEYYNEAAQMKGSY